MVEAIRLLKDGAVGRVLEAKCYYLFSDRKSIGKGRGAPVPDGLDWALWQGPAPERPYRDNVVHYNWHWFWHWGTSELGNNGVHTIDMARWGLGVDWPVRVTSNGGRLRYDDDQETPDTNIASFTFANGTMITWEGRSWGGKRPSDPPHQIAYYGDQGTLTVSGSGYAAFDRRDQEIAKSTGSGGDAEHLKNWLDAIRGAAKLNADIEEGWKSTLLCHLGNIAWRSGRTVHFDPEARRLKPDRDAESLWSRDYRAGWEPKC
jgi:predicted dehydrogenase